MRLVYWTFCILGLAPTLAFGFSKQLDVDKTLEVRRGGLTINHAILFASKSSNLTGSIEKFCDGRPFWNSSATLNLVLYHDNYKLMDQTSTNLADVENVKLKFKHIDHCRQFLAAIEKANEADENRFQLSIDSKKLIFQHEDRQQWPLIDATSKMQKKHI